MELRLFPEQASTIAAAVDDLVLFLTAISGFVSILIFIAVAYFAVRYRKSQKKVDRSLPPTHSLVLEITWSVAPLFVFLFIFAWATKLYVETANPPPDAIEIYGSGKQWMWKFQHQEGTREINELHVPLGKPMKVILSSEDTIHSFYVPAFRVKMDVVPGRYTIAWFEATKTGTYHLFCAEYCGTNHSAMIGRVVVMTPADYQAWLGGGNEPLAVRGAKLFESFGCKSCHDPAAAPATDPLAAAIRGPTLAGLFGTQVLLADGTKVDADEEYLRESLLRPQAKIVSGYKPVMPTYEGQLDEDSIAQLLAFIKAMPKADASAAR